MKNLGNMLKQAQQMQAKMTEMQEALDAYEAEGVSGAGMVRVNLNGKGDLRGVKIDPELLKPEDAEVIEDLIAAAFNDAKGKVDAHKKEKMAELTGGLPLPPGMNLPF